MRDPIFRDPLPIIGLIVWVLAVLCASAIYRRVVGKPVWFFGFENASFMERAASGHRSDYIFRWLGSASNCLVVAVVGNRFVVRPIFPFNLGFLPEIYGLEHDIEISKVVRAELGRFLFWKTLVVTFRDDRKERSLTLYLKEPEKLAEILMRGRAR